MKTIKIGDDPSVYATGNDNCKTSTTGTSDQKPKELDWEKEFDNKFGTNQAYIIKTGFVSSNEPQMELSDVKQFISTLLSTQRQQILEEIKTRVDTWGGFEDDGGNLCHYDSEILEWVNDLLNKKNEN